MKTGQYRDHLVDDIVDRCFVMFHTRFHRGRPRGFPPDKEVYVCEARYNEDRYTFNRIKTWTSCLPDEVRERDYEMDLYPIPRKLKKEQTPIAHLLADNAKETDPLPKPNWGHKDAPPIIGGVHMRPREPNVSHVLYFVFLLEVSLSFFPPSTSSLVASLRSTLLSRTGAVLEPTTRRKLPLHKASHTAQPQSHPISYRVNRVRLLRRPSLLPKFFSEVSLSKEEQTEGLIPTCVHQSVKTSRETKRHVFVSETDKLDPCTALIRILLRLSPPPSPQWFHRPRWPPSRFAAHQCPCP